MKNKDLIIIGLSNNSKLAAYYFETDTLYNVIGFAVNSKYKNVDFFKGLPVFELESLEVNFPPSQVDVFVAIGYKEMNTIRENLYKEIKRKGYFLPNYISSKCTFLTQEQIGDNNFILEDNTIQPFVKIGSNNVFWSGNHIGHDVEIGNHNFITSHVVISGFTKIKDNCFLGVNATLRDDIEIANKTLIAAGAIIMKSTKEEQVYIGAKTVLLDAKSTEIKIS
jgi:sugar O-acyltransferase (sialic acid O-acetyltransferase NeuD family)